MSDLKITIPQGNTKSVKFTLTQDGSAWDVSAYTHKLYVKSGRSESASADVTLTGSVGGTDNNEVTFSFTNAQTKALSVADYYYDYMIYAADASLVKTVAQLEPLEITFVLEKDV